jgi:molybdate transport system ATP-binding protein
MTPPLLDADFDLHRHAFRLHVRLQVGPEILVLFGPSGSGKTTTLDTLAGLVAPERGHITLAGQIVFQRHDRSKAIDVPARRRRVGYVFQHYALFPHLSAAENIGFPLRGPNREKRLAELLARMHLTPLAARYPHELSGGQQQRVAIARALASDPAILLLDEPFSALDVAVRQHLQRDLVMLQREMGLPVIYVTHRLEDAFAVGQRLAVMHDGQLEQVGPIADVFRRPANPRVAEIMGIANLFRATVTAAYADGLALDWDGLPLLAPPQSLAPGAVVTAYIRPEDVKILYPDRPVVEAVRENQSAGRVVASQLHPGGHVLHVRLSNGHEIELRYADFAYASLGLQPGDEVRLTLRREALVVINERK